MSRRDKLFLVKDYISNLCAVCDRTLSNPYWFNRKDGKKYCSDLCIEKAGLKEDINLVIQFR